MLRCFIPVRGLVVLLTLAALLTSACSTPAKKETLPLTDSSLRAYMEFRASHAGLKIPPRQLPSETIPPAPSTSPTTVAMTPPPKTSLPEVSKEAPVASVALATPKPHEVKPAKAPSAPQAPPAPKTSSVKGASRPAAQGVVAATMPVKVAKVSKPKSHSKSQSHPRVKPASVKRRPSSQSMITRNTSLVASDGYLASSLSVTAKERHFKPIRSKTPARPLAPVVSLDDLVRQARAADAINVLRQINNVSLPVAAEAMRIVLKTKPAGGESRLFAVVRNAKEAAVRAMAIDTLFRAYPGKATYSAQRLLHLTRYNRTDRLVVGNRILQYRVSRTFTAAVTNLGYDHSGKAFFDARRSVLAADKRITRALKNYQTQYTGKPSAFIAQRLYHWIRNDDSIEDAYADTFKHHPTAMGVVLFQERFGDEAGPWLKKARVKAKRSLRAAIEKALADLERVASRPSLRLGSVRLFVIEYQTPEEQLRILTNRAIGADQMPHETVTYTSHTGHIRQYVTTLDRAEVAKLKKMDAQWQAGVQVAGKPVDLIDLK